jgi:hypothetical protein
MTQSRTQEDLSQTLALVETLKRVRGEVSQHVEAGEGAPRVPPRVYYVVQDILEGIDLIVERLMTDDERDEAIDESVEDIDRG